tara:strand:+ start:128 stop:586 length:459 start_codon:yes stop_codon:yes gene_type:complete
MKHFALTACILAGLMMPDITSAQSVPIVVLEYPKYGGAGETPGLNADNMFVSDPTYSTTHRVQPNETLSHVIAEHYAGSGLDLSVVQIAIVKKNKSAFVRGNPNFLYADKVLHLPSLNEMQDLVLGSKASNHGGANRSSGGPASDQIYFIGG